MPPKSKARPTPKRTPVVVRTYASNLREPLMDKNPFKHDWQPLWVKHTRPKSKAKHFCNFHFLLAMNWVDSSVGLKQLISGVGQFAAELRDANFGLFQLRLDQGREGRVVNDGEDQNNPRPLEFIECPEKIGKSYLLEREKSLEKLTFKCNWCGCFEFMFFEVTTFCTEERQNLQLFWNFPFDLKQKHFFGFGPFDQKSHGKTCVHETEIRKLQSFTLSTSTSKEVQRESWTQVPAMISPILKCTRTHPKTLWETSNIPYLVL